CRGLGTSIGLSSTIGAFFVFVNSKLHYIPFMQGYWVRPPSNYQTQKPPSGGFLLPIIYPSTFLPAIPLTHFPKILFFLPQYPAGSPMFLKLTPRLCLQKDLGNQFSNNHLNGIIVC
ncbi:hypothetical protein K8O68_09280, partial [Salipaludibacillus sp. CUR1]|uniref:hypothetical protein n=1 Tax=Salipaludibacillus sp. CUR1 TaxID=2820003 RepID=UPI001E384537